MVNGISTANNAAYVSVPEAAPAGYSKNILPASSSQQEIIDEFVHELEIQRKKNIRNKNIGGGVITGCSLLALLGGTLFNSKLGRALSIAPIALTALFLGGMALATGNKKPDYRSIINEALAAGSMHADTSSTNKA